MTEYGLLMIFSRSGKGGVSLRKSRGFILRYGLPPLIGGSSATPNRAELPAITCARFHDLEVLKYRTSLTCLTPQQSISGKPILYQRISDHPYRMPATFFHPNLTSCDRSFLGRRGGITQSTPLGPISRWLHVRLVSGRELVSIG